VAILAAPVMPGSAAKLLDSLGQDGKQRSFAWLGESGRLKPGTLLPAPTAVFPRYLGEGGEGGGKPPKPQKS
jgi:methionyl-tRNA synthetase